MGRNVGTSTVQEQLQSQCYIRHETYLQMVSRHQKPPKPLIFEIKDALKRRSLGFFQKIDNFIFLLVRKALGPVFVLHTPTAHILES